MSRKMVCLDVDDLSKWKSGCCAAVYKGLGLTGISCSDGFKMADFHFSKLNWLKHWAATERGRDYLRVCKNFILEWGGFAEK